MTARGFFILLTGLIAIMLAAHWGDKPDVLIDVPPGGVTLAHLCLPPSPPLLGPKEGDAIYPLTRKESSA